MKENCNTFKKHERLNRKRYIDALFLKGVSFYVYPLRVICITYDATDCDEIAEASILINAPKRHFKHAVKRNRIKRLIRESYRLQKHSLTDSLRLADKAMHIAFLYTSKELPSYNLIYKSIGKALNSLQNRI